MLFWFRTYEQKEKKVALNANHPNESHFITFLFFVLERISIFSTLHLIKRMAILYISLHVRAMKKYRIETCMAIEMSEN